MWAGPELIVRSCQRRDLFPGHVRGEMRVMAKPRDVVVVGGGHNGLVGAAYLARSGLDTLVCERRGVVGGAAVSEHPFGPGYTVASLSYVVSLLSPGLVRDLGLASHGYHVYPQGPYFAPRTLAPAGARPPPIRAPPGTAAVSVWSTRKGSSTSTVATTP